MIRNISVDGIKLRIAGGFVDKTTITRAVYGSNFPATGTFLVKLQSRETAFVYLELPMGKSAGREEGGRVVLRNQTLHVGNPQDKVVPRVVSPLQILETHSLRAPNGSGPGKEKYFSESDRVLAICTRHKNDFER